MIKHYVPMNPKRSEFFKDMQTMSIPELSDKYNHKGLVRSAVIAIKPYIYKIGVFGAYMKMKRLLRKRR